MTSALMAMVLTCGWFDEGPRFTFEGDPESWEGFVGGDLGFLRPGTPVDGLVVAYRVLNGRPLTAAERTRFLERHASVVEPPIDGPAEWAAARATVLTTEERVSPYAQMRAQADTWGALLNCNDDAFVTAAATLKARTRDYPTRELLIGWVVAQDVVFSNCAGPRALPPPLTTGPQLAQTDREYQIAAARFYAGDYDEAALRFRAIAADSRSPWQGIAGYLEARALVRKGLLGKQTGRDLPALEVALKALKTKAAAQPEDANLARLLSYARLRARPAEEAHARATEFLQSLDRPDLHDALTDFAFALSNPVPAEVSTVAHDLSDWVCVMSPSCPMSVRSPAGTAIEDLARAGVAAEKWKQTGALHWLLAALLRADARQPDAPGLMAAVERLPAAWPGTKTARLELARLYIAQGRTADARTVLDGLLPATNAEGNRIRALKLEVPRDALDLVAAARRVPIERGAPAASECLDGRGADLLNRALPVSALAAALEVKPNALIATAAFVRAALLDDETLARALLPHVRAAQPKLAPQLDAWAAATAAAEREFATAHLLLVGWGLGPNLPGGFCASEPGARFGAAAWCPGANTGAVPASLAGAEREAALRERAAVDALGPGIDHLTRVATAWARTHPKDPRSPEALALAVKHARNHPCRSDASAALSRSAFRLLHAAHGRTAAAKATPYWY